MNNLPEWIKAKKYAELSGYSYGAIKQKIYRGDWPEGVLWCNAPDRALMINWRNVDKWAAGRLDL